MSDLILIGAGGEICSLAQEIDALAESMVERLEGTAADNPEAVIDATLKHIILLAFTAKRLAKLVEDLGEVIQKHPAGAKPIGAAAKEAA